MRFIEAFAVWSDWEWMKWFAAASGGIYIRVEVYEVFNHVSWAKFTALGINTLVVAYLFFALAKEPPAGSSVIQAGRELRS